MQTPVHHVKLLLASAAAFAAAPAVLAQHIPSAQHSPLLTESPIAEFQFSRLIYPSGYGWGRGSALVDWPDAEYHFMQGLTRLTRVDGAIGSRGWFGFNESLKRVFPDRPWVEIPESDEVMHVLYDLDKSTQIPGVRALYSGRTWEEDGFTPHWRGIYDDQGRLLIAINFNMDLGDAWEHADTPGYPEPMTAMAYRFAVNYVIYAMTH